MLIPKFLDPNLEEEITETGFVVIPNFLSQGEIATLMDLFKSHYKEESTGFWNSISNLPSRMGFEISERIKSITDSHFEKLLEDWNFPVAQFIVKNPGKNSASNVHRDFTLYDEEVIQYRQVWVPMVDLNAENGTLYVVPKSHKLFTNIRPMFAKWPYDHLVKHLEKEFHPIYAKAGDLIMYLDKTLHGSCVNMSSEPRPAFTGGIIHKDANILYARYNEQSNEVTSYEVDDAFYYAREFEKPVIDKKYKLIGTEKYSVKEISSLDLDEFFNPAG